MMPFEHSDLPPTGDGALPSLGLALNFAEFDKYQSSHARQASTLPKADLLRLHSWKQHVWVLGCFSLHREYCAPGGRALGQGDVVLRRPDFLQVTDIFL